VEQGESIEFTERGMPIVVIGPVPVVKKSCVQELIDRGLMTPGQGDLARTEVVRAVAQRAPTHLELAFDIVEQAKLIHPTRALLDTAARHCRSTLPHDSRRRR